jgi:hypothetical protein
VSISCTSFLHYLLITASTIIILGYYTYVFIQHQLYTSYRYTSPLPWAGYDRTTSMAKSIFKFVLVCSYILGESLEYHLFIIFHFTSFLINVYLLSKRLSNELRFKRAIQFTEVTLDVLTANLLLVICVHSFVVDQGY